MFKKLLYAIYYLIIFNLPHGRYFGAFNFIRAFYVCKLMNVGKYHPNTRIQNKVYLSGIGKVRIGTNCQINENTFIQGAVIGDNVMIAPNVSILSNVKNFESKDTPMNLQGWAEKDKFVIIENDVCDW